MVNHISMSINSPQPGTYEVNMHVPHYNLTVDGPDMPRKAQGKTPQEAIQNLLKELHDLVFGCMKKAFDNGTITLSQDNGSQTLMCEISVLDEGFGSIRKTCSGFDFSQGKTIGATIKVNYEDGKSFDPGYKSFNVR